MRSDGHAANDRLSPRDAVLVWAASVTFSWAVIGGTVALILWMFGLI